MAQSPTSFSAAAPLGTRDYLIIGGGLIAIAAAGWAYMVYMAWAMDHHQHHHGGAAGLAWMAPPSPQPWTLADLFMLFAVWSVMMIAMMVPSAMPMIMMFTAVNRGRRQRDQTYVPTFIFTLGYLVAWVGFSLIVALAQWRLHVTGLLDSKMNSNSSLLNGIVLVAAGVYQWTPLKEACLHQCRTPLGFLASSWRDGRLGAMTMGLRHGLFCIGCCWAMMLVMLAVGVMNMLWALLIAVFVVIEKIMPLARTVRAISGLGLVAWGMYWLAIAAI